MKKFTFILAGAVAGAVLLTASAASAASGMAAGSSMLATSGESMIVQVQRGARGIRGAGGGGRAIVRGGGGGGRAIVRRGGGRGIGGAGAAAIGLGILGAAVAAGAAQSAQPDYSQCWVERRPVQDRWGNFLGYRRVRICN